LFVIIIEYRVTIG